MRKVDLEEGGSTIVSLMVGEGSVVRTVKKTSCTMSILWENKNEWVLP